MLSVRTISRRRLSNVPRRIHQAVARRPHPQKDDSVVVDATIDSLLADYARRGNTQQFESLMESRTVSLPPTERQRDLHVKAHIVNASLSTTQHFPTSALAVLHQYEASGHCAPIQSYTRLISALFNVQTTPLSNPRLGRTAAYAHAWDLFAHMRYVAHPVPDSHLYALMIRACGSSSRPEPERALDLWSEMQENGVEPTKGAYEAVIRVCGRARPEWLGEGMRLARELSDQHSIDGMSRRGVWCALLEGCKRAGDLKRARWILAEAVRGSSSQDSMVDAELMTHVFHTYASYKPPFSRQMTRLVSEGTSVAEGVSSNDTRTESSDESHGPSHGIAEPVQQRDDETLEVPVENIESMPSFSRIPPQTPSDVVTETRALFSRILLDRSLSPEDACSSSQGGLLTGVFTHVELTPILVNAYLSVFYRHASIETSQEVFDSLFGKSGLSSPLGLYPDEHTHVNALERCAIAGVEDRQTAVRWAKDVWRRWETLEAKAMRDGKINIGSYARLIEKAHAAMRRILILSGDIDGAQTLLQSFVSRYPPNAVLQPSQPSTLDTPPMSVPIKSPSIVRLFAKPPILSTRTVLTNPVSGARPLIRLTSAASVKDDCVPPIIAFSDVDLLHARLAEQGRIKEIGYIKWVCMAYANALKRRRRAVLRTGSVVGTTS